MQPENPAQLGGKIYEMMGMALSGKWSTPFEVQHPGVGSNNTETIEAEVVEPVEAGSQKWGSNYFFLILFSYFTCIRRNALGTALNGGLSL